MVKVITMVKDEVDIIKDWVLYHSFLFGFNNIYVIDNYSTDGTYEELLKFGNLINVSRQSNYTEKGNYMRSYIDKYCDPEEIAFPIDTDEFIVYYDPINKILSTDKDDILHYIQSLPPHNVYKMNQIGIKYTNNDVVNYPNGFMHAPIEAKYGFLCEFNIFNKGFINSSINHGNIDMGNHFLTNNHYKTNLCLIHYHCRNLEQIKKKILNNILGLGYKNDLNFLIELQKTQHVKGIHHVNNQIAVLKNEFIIHPSNNDVLDIDLTDFCDLIIDLNTIDITTIDLNTQTNSNKNINDNIFIKMELNKLSKKKTQILKQIIHKKNN